MRSCLAVLVVSALGCGGNDAASPPPAPAPPPIVAATPKPKPAPPAPDLSLGTGFRMAHPIRDGRISVIPIIATSPVIDAASYLTLADGLAGHVVTVREIGRNDAFEVDTVRIKNKSRRPLFVMRGEMIIDGLQDRVIAEDRVISPGASVRVSVRCVEMGREVGSVNFHSGQALVEVGLRQTIAYKNQTDVWTKVDEINRRLGLTPPSKTYRLAAQLQMAPAANARRTRLFDALGALPEHDRLVGLAQVIDGEVVAIDRFATAELFAALEVELLGSYIASDDGAPHEGRTLLPADVRALAAGPDAQQTAASFTVLRKSVPGGVGPGGAL